MKQKILPLCIGVFCLSVLAGVAIFAWTEPNTTPPGDNVAAPVNIGSEPQIKAGALESLVQVKAPKVCIGADCRTAWPVWGSGADQNCPSGQSVTGISGVGTISCAVSGGGGGDGCTVETCPGGTCVAGVCVGSGMLPQSACVNQLSTGNRRVFVTSQTYRGNQFTTEAAADDLCYNAAKNAGMPDGEARNFKALTAVAARDPMSLLTASQYWNGVKITGSTLCEWKHIASPSSFFSDSGIDNPINHDQWGNPVDGATTVMTSFKPNAGAPEVLQYSNFGSGYCSQAIGDWRKSGPCGGGSDSWFGGCAFGACHYSCSTFKHWYGKAWEKKTKWAYSDTTEVLSEAGCLDIPRALYCVEKY